MLSKFRNIKSIPMFDFESCLDNNQISFFQEEDEVEVEVEATVVVVMGREKQNKCLKNTRYYISIYKQICVLL